MPRLMENVFPQSSFMETTIPLSRAEVFVLSNFNSLSKTLAIRNVSSHVAQKHMLFKNQS